LEKTELEKQFTDLINFDMKTNSQDLFEGFPFPKTSEQEVLLTLITQGHVSIFDFSYLSGFRTRVSELQSNYGLTLERVTDTRCNKFGNNYTYAIHKLPASEASKLISVAVIVPIICQSFSKVFKEPKLIGSPHHPSSNLSLILNLIIFEPFEILNAYHSIGTLTP